MLWLTSQDFDKIQGKSSIYRRGSLHCRTNFQDMTMTRWRERGLGADWLKMAANNMIGSENFRRQISVGRGAGWREINAALSCALDFCYGKLYLARTASALSPSSIVRATNFLCVTFLLEFPVVFWCLVLYLTCFYFAGIFFLLSSLLWFQLNVIKCNVLFFIIECFSVIKIGNDKLNWLS